jgi:hypothetical protein
MKKILLLTGIVIILLAMPASAYIWETIWNPFTYNVDYYVTSNFTGHNVTADYYMGDGSLLTGMVTSYWNLSGSNLSTASPGYNVGIGTTTPSNKLDVIGSVNITENLTVDGYLHTGADPRGLESFLKSAGDVVFGNRLIVEKSINTYASPYGVGLNVHEYSNTLNLTSLGGTANLNGTTKVLCDTDDPFLAHHDDMVLTVIDSTPSFTDATGEILDVLNSTCIVLSFGSAGSDTIVDATGMTYIIYPHPIQMILDNGYVSFNVGENPDAKFEVHIDNGTGFHGFYIEDTAGADQHQSFTVDTDGKGYDGIVGMNNFVYSSQPAEHKRMTNLLLEADTTGINHSEGYGIEIKLLGQPGPGTKYDGILLDPNINHILHMGSSEVITKAYYDNGTTTDVTTAFTSTGTNIELFRNDNSYIYIGNTANFTNIGISLSTEGSKNINSEYYYCNKTGWFELPEVTDTTNGMRVSGTITFTNPSDRGTCAEEYDGTPFANITNYTYIAIKRTANAIPGQKPVENLISISGGSTWMFMDKYGIKPLGSDGAPYVCSQTYAGMTFYDSTAVALLWCDGSNWIEFAETADITIHNNLGGLQGGKATQYYHLDSANYTVLTNAIPAPNTTAGIQQLVNDTGIYSTYNATYAVLVTDNATWNESLANTLYADISVVDTQKSAVGPPLTNDSTTMSVNSTWFNQQYANLSSFNFTSLNDVNFSQSGATGTIVYWNGTSKRMEALPTPTAGSYLIHRGTGLSLEWSPIALTDWSDVLDIGPGSGGNNPKLTTNDHLEFRDANNYMYSNATDETHFIINSGGTLEIGDATNRMTIDNSGNMVSKNVEMEGGLIVPVRISTTTTTSTGADNFIIVVTNGGDRTLNLHDVSALGTTRSQVFYVLKSGAANTLTIDPYGGATIDGAATKAITANLHSIRIQSYNSNWFTVTDNQ